MASENTVVNHVFLTGEPGIGKSTIVSHVLMRLATAVVATGFVTIEQRDQSGARIGFRSINVADREDSVQLASLGKSDDHCIGPFHVHLVETVAFCRRALSPASSGARPRLCFMDEIGAMQLLSAELEQLFGSIIDARECHCFGTLPPKGHHNLQLVEALRERADVRVLEVTEENRDELVEVVCSLLYRVCFPEELAASIEGKAALAKRYATELDMRVELIDHQGNALRFAGEHGTYELRRGTREDPFACTCPFFSEHGTCSHTLALALQREVKAWGHGKTAIP